MAEYKADNKTVQDAVTPATLLAAEQIGGKERVIFDQITLAGEAAGSIIVLPELPLGAKITDWVIDHAALGTGVSLKFGNRSDDDALFAAATCITADKKNMTDDGISTALGYVCDTADKCKPIITTAGQAATGLVKVMIKFVTKN